VPRVHWLLLLLLPQGLLTQHCSLSKTCWVPMMMMMALLTQHHCPGRHHASHDMHELNQLGST
jgi:hypothetical protein